MIIVEPNTSTRRATPSDMYFIQHQQVIKPPIISGDDDRLIQHKTHSCGDSCSVVKLIPNPVAQSSLSSTSSSSSASSSNNFSALSSTFNLYAAATIAASSTPLQQQSHEKQEETSAKISFDIINSVLNQNHTVVASSDLLLQQPVNTSSSSSPTLSLLLSNLYCFFCLIDSLAYFIFYYFNFYCLWTILIWDFC